MNSTICSRAGRERSGSGFEQWEEIDVDVVDWLKVLKWMEKV